MISIWKDAPFMQLKTDTQSERFIDVTSNSDSDEQINFTSQINV